MARRAMGDALMHFRAAMRSDGSRRALLTEWRTQAIARLAWVAQRSAQPRIQGPDFGSFRSGRVSVTTCSHAAAQPILGRRAVRLFSTLADLRIATRIMRRPARGVK